MLAAILRYRGFILGSVKRELQLRYRSSMLGALWLVLQPLAMILVYTLIFSQVMRAKLPNMNSTYAYSIYLCSGSLTWTFFLETVSRCQNMFLENANMLKKLSFPRICLPIIVAISSSLNFLIVFGLFIIFLIVSGSFPGLAILTLFPLLLLQLIFALSLGLTLGVLNVFFRDVGQIMTIVFQFWFWFTPIVYPSSIIPEWAKSYFQLNPMTNLVVSYQTILVSHQVPNWLGLWPITLCSVLFFGLGIHLFKKHSGDMVDEL